MEGLGQGADLRKETLRSTSAESTTAGPEEETGGKSAEPETIRGTRQVRGIRQTTRADGGGGGGPGRDSKTIRGIDQT
jgi:hypothetical protein